MLMYTNQKDGGTADPFWWIMGCPIYRNLQFPKYWDLGLPQTSTDFLPTIFCQIPLVQVLRMSSSWRMEYVPDIVGEDSSTRMCC